MAGILHVAAEEFFHFTIVCFFELFEDEPLG